VTRVAVTLRHGLDGVRDDGQVGTAPAIQPGTSSAGWALGKTIAAAEQALALFAAAGCAAFVATLVHGRTALFWPSAAWAGTAGAIAAVLLVCWWAARQVAGGGAWRRGQLAAWPILPLLLPACTAVAVYADDVSHHLLASSISARQSLLAYTLALFAGGQVIYWAVMIVRRRHRGRHGGDDGQGEVGQVETAQGATSGVSGAPPWVVAGLAAAAYVNASVFLTWPPAQTDLYINLRAAQELSAGVLPYHDEIPVWADRVHHLPVTLVLLFGPLAALPPALAGLAFFAGNQVLWLAGIGLLAWRFAPASSRALWIVGALALGAAFWPWQESIRFGQQDGLLVFLFAVALTAAARGRDRWAGIALGLAFIVKPLSIWLPLIFLLHRRWRALLAAGVTGAVVVLATLPLTGTESWLHFVWVELPAMLPGTVRGTNIPLASLHARFFVEAASLSDGEAAPRLAAIGALNLGATVLGLLLVLHLAVERGRANGEAVRRWLLDFSLGLTLTLLLAPMAWQHYASWLSIAFVVITLPFVWLPVGSAARAAAGVLAGMSFLLLSLEDGRLTRLLAPLVEHWPAALAAYPLGLLCLGAAIVALRFGDSRSVLTPPA
jgi:hypothetical protein